MHPTRRTRFWKCCNNASTYGLCPQPSRQLPFKLLGRLLSLASDSMASLAARAWPGRSLGGSARPAPRRPHVSPNSCSCSAPRSARGSNDQGTSLTPISVASGSMRPQIRLQVGPGLMVTARPTDRTEVPRVRKRLGLALSSARVGLKRATRRANPHVTGGFGASVRSARRCS
jgi:hypothetical protein